MQTLPGNDFPAWAGGEPLGQSTFTGETRSFHFDRWDVQVTMDERSAGVEFRWSTPTEERLSPVEVLVRASPGPPPPKTNGANRTGNGSTVT